eukprot:6758609-Pyramimonas_sp.AAC.1
MDPGSRLTAAPGRARTERPRRVAADGPWQTALGCTSTLSSRGMSRARSLCCSPRASRVAANRR